MIPSFYLFLCDHGACACYIRISPQDVTKLSFLQAFHEIISPSYSYIGIWKHWALDSQSITSDLSRASDLSSCIHNKLCCAEQLLQGMHIARSLYWSHTSSGAPFVLFVWRAVVIIKGQTRVPLSATVLWNCGLPTGYLNVFSSDRTCWLDLT